MADLPTGTVTFVFSDIEGSTRLLERSALATATPSMLRLPFEVEQLGQLVECQLRHPQHRHEPARGRVLEVGRLREIRFGRREAGLDEAARSEDELRHRPE
jgi:hypothetical protein